VCQYVTLISSAPHTVLFIWLLNPWIEYPHVGIAQVLFSIVIGKHFWQHRCSICLLDHSGLLFSVFMLMSTSCNCVWFGNTSTCKVLNCVILDHIFMMHDLDSINCMPCVWVLYIVWCVFTVVCALKTLENVKLTQIEKFHKAKSDFERESIKLDPKKVMQQAVENCKPLLILKQVHRGGVVYQVCNVTPFYQLWCNAAVYTNVCMLYRQGLHAPMLGFFWQKPVSARHKV